MNPKQGAFAEDVPSMRPLRVFLCHSSEDKRSVRDLHTRLKSGGVEPWLDELALLPGQEWDREIGSAVRSSDVVLICLSSTSVNKAGYIQREIRYALDVADRQPEGTIFLIPARLENCEVPERLRHWQWVNLYEADGFDRLIVSLTNRCKALERLPPKTDSRTDDWLASVFSSLNPKFSFDTYVVGACNQFAHAAARSVATFPSRSYNPLVICGGVGTGKTHLLQAIGRELFDRSSSMRIIYTSSERFMHEMVTSIRDGHMIAFQQRYREADVLLVDDIQLIGNKERTQEEFYHTFCELHDQQRQVVLTSDSPPKDIPGLNHRLRSRFESGLLVDIQAPDLETKMGVLDKRAGEEGIQFPVDVLSLIASKTRSNFRELEGTLTKLIAYSSLTGTPISLSLAVQILRHHGDMLSRKVTIRSIQQAVAERFEIKGPQLKTKTTDQRIVFPRQVAMYLVHELTAASLSDIGRAFGGKHPTTVMNSITKISNLRLADGDLNRLINAIVDTVQ